jgi:arylsulfatase A-like enzyme
VLKEAGIYDQTLIVLTSDHGMELLDPSVNGSPLAGLTKEVGVTTASHFVYIRQLGIAGPATLALGSNTATFTVTDRDGAEPVGEATVTVAAGGVTLAEGATATDGTVALTFDLAAAGDVTVTARQGGFTTETVTIGAQ